MICRCLKPDMGKKGKCKTQIKKRTLNPEFNEVCKSSWWKNEKKTNELNHNSLFDQCVYISWQLTNCLDQMSGIQL